MSKEQDSGQVSRVTEEWRREPQCSQVSRDDQANNLNPSNFVGLEGTSLRWDLEKQNVAVK